MGEIELANLFSWATTNPPNWLQGILYVVLGVFGALVTIYFVIGGTIPTASGAKLEDEFKELEKKNKELSELRQKALENPSTANPALIDAFSNDADKQRDDLERKRQGMFRSWSLLYVLLGGFFSALLAQDLLQAITIGAGWTSVLAAFGLNKEKQEAKSEATKQADIVEQSIKDLEKKLAQLKTLAASSDTNLEWDSSWDFEDTVETAEQAIRQTKLRSAIG
ncbi:hypothetical protein FBQ81_09255 [Chloroflexi bacterium CFX6]|nr:hypothetical protein [Chloroflexi bacterium CFX6]